ncbi:hypothetical protein A2U01_0104783, partial [Trifolium medium]|nr:hypothetical protein [Trifolium medium]
HHSIMSNTTDSSQIKTQGTVTPAKGRSTRSKANVEDTVIVADVVPLTTVHPSDLKSKSKPKSVVKKEKSMK